MANAKSRKGKIVKADRSGVRESVEEAEAEDRPISVQAARIIKQYFEGKR
jgi:hypothetical protein